MRKVYLIICIVIGVTAGFAQSGRSDRSSMSIIQLDYKDSFTDDIRRLFEQVKIDNRYDINDIPTKHIRVSGDRTQVVSDGNYKTPDRTQSLISFLNDNNIGKEVIVHLFDRDSQTGKMSLQRIQNRGLFNASDQNIVESRATKRGIEGLSDYGFSLIGNSYFLIFDFANIRYAYDNGSKSDYYWYTTPVAYLFRIEWNESLQNELFDCWIDDNTAESEKPDKRRRFDALQIPVQFITKKAFDTYSQATGIEEQNQKAAKGEKRKYTNEQLKENAFVTLIAKAADDTGEAIEKEHKAFHIENSIYAVHPIRSKIGKKEGIRVNDRYFVYENVLQEDNSIRQKRRGVVRATNHIAANNTRATGQMPTTEFYQIAGGPVEEGMTMEEKHSLYFNLDVGYRYGQLEGVYAGISTNLYATKAANHNAMLGITVLDKAITATLDYGFGLRCNNFDLYPYVGIGLDYFMKDKEKDGTDYDGLDNKNNALIAQGGVRFDLNIYYPFQLFGAAEYNYLFMEGETYKAKMIAKDRDINGFNVYGGIRICF